MLEGSARAQPLVSATRAGALAPKIAVAVPALATVGLAFTTAERGLAAPLIAVAVLATTAGIAARARFNWRSTSPSARVATIALAVLVVWTALSAARSGGHAAWADAVYALVALVSVGSFAASRAGARARRAMFVSVSCAFASLSVLALVVRLVPDLVTVPLGGQTDRISYPLGHWNAAGLVAGLALIAFFHMAADDDGPALVRIGTTSLLPALALCLLLTSSRGAMACTGLGLLAYAAAARPRGLLSAAAAAAVPTGAILWLGYKSTAISGYDPTSGAAVAEGRKIGLALLGCMAVAAVLRAALLPTDAALRKVTFSRTRVGLAMAFVAALVVVAAVGAGVPHKIERGWRTFDGHHQAYHPGTGDRFTNFSSNDRLDRWRAAWRTGRAHVALGQGAGSFAFDAPPPRMHGTPTRLETESNTDAQSVILEAFAEVGLIGAACVALALAALLVGTAAAARGPGRRLHGVVFALLVAWTAHALIDMNWQIPAISIAVLALSGMAVSGSDFSQPRHEEAAARSRR